MQISLFGYQDITRLETLIARLSNYMNANDELTTLEYRVCVSESLYLDYLGCLDSEML